MHSRVSGSTAIADGGESLLLFVITAMRAMPFIRGVSWDGKSADYSHVERGDKGDTRIAWEGFPWKSMCPQSVICYLIINMIWEKLKQMDVNMGKS